MVRTLRGDVIRGYASDFLGIDVPTPTPSEIILRDVLRWQGGTILPYTHFSLAMSVTRRFAYWAA
jgi:endonuclease G